MFACAFVYFVFVSVSHLFIFTRYWFEKFDFSSCLSFKWQKSSTSATHETSATPTPVKPKLAPKPVVESSPTKNATMPRKSIFATGPSAGGKDGLIACSLCGRNFASDRIEKHEGICAKTKAKKRKVFDITKMRVKGTEAESFVLAPPGRNNQQNNNSSNKKPISIGQHILQQQQQAAKVTAAPSAKESVRQRHLEFLIS